MAEPSLVKTKSDLLVAKFPQDYIDQFKIYAFHDTNKEIHHEDEYFIRYYEFQECLVYNKITITNYGRMTVQRDHLSNRNSTTEEVRKAGFRLTNAMIKHIVETPGVRHLDLLDGFQRELDSMFVHHFGFMNVIIKDFAETREERNRAKIGTDVKILQDELTTARNSLEALKANQVKHEEEIALWKNIVSELLAKKYEKSHFI